MAKADPITADIAPSAAENTDDFADIELDEYTPTSIAGPYDRHVRATLAADERLEANDPDAYDEGKRTKFSILVPRGDQGTDKDGAPNGKYPDVDKEVRFVQDSARTHNRTARKIDQVDQGDGYTKLSFILIPKQSRPRKNAAEVTDGADVPEESDTPTETE